MNDMKHSAALLLLALTALTAVLSARPVCAAPLPAEAAQVAKDFLFAFSRNDREVIKGMLPKGLANLYGPCPFNRMPSLSNPRADGRIGAIDFEAPSVDPGLPKKGIIVLRLVEEEKVKAWRVRQIYWFQELPTGAQIPDHSPTSADRRQEPAVRQGAFEFLRAWLAKDFERLDGLTFHWWNVPRRPPRWVKMTRVSVEGRPTTLEGLRVSFSARLRFAGLLPRHVEGNLWLVNENGAWRVRPITFSLLF